MPYRLRKAPRRNLYWVIGEDGRKHSKEPIPKERAEAQRRALYAAMNKELKGGIIDRDTFERRQKKGAYPKNLSYEKFAELEMAQSKKIEAEKERLAQANEEYLANTDEVACNLTKDLERGRDVVERSECLRRHQELDDKLHPENKIFRPLMKGVVAAADQLKSFAPPVIKEIGEAAIQRAKQKGYGLPPPILGMGGYDEEELVGEGFFGDVWNAAKALPSKIIGRVRDVSRGVRLDYPPRVRDILSKFGNSPIVSLHVRRDPIRSMLHTVLNLITLGRWNTARQKYNYDKLFHLGLEAVVRPNPESELVHRFTIEKNEVINISPAKSVDADTEMVPVDLREKSLTINQLLEGGKAIQGDGFFRYDAWTNNCQDFIVALLRGSDISTDSLEKFVKQPLEKLLPELPGYTAKLARATTDLAAIGNVALYGRGAPSAAFKKQLDALGISPDVYLREARKRAKAFGVDATKLTFAPDSKHKLQIESPSGKHVKFGASGLGDFILYSLSKNPAAHEHRKRYLARATKIRGNWASDKYSPNSLAINVLW
jgi:hypothetical protein